MGVVADLAEGSGAEDLAEPGLAAVEDAILIHVLIHELLLAPAEHAQSGDCAASESPGCGL